MEVSKSESVKKKKRRLRLEEKLKIIDAVDRGFSYAEIASQYGISIGSIAYINSNKQTYLSAIEKGYNLDIKKTPTEVTQRCDQEIKEFIEKSLNANLPLSRNLITTVAKESYTDNGKTNFKGSNGYYNRLKKRLNLKKLKLPEDDAAVDSLKLHKWKLASFEIISEYTQNNIYNLDETGLLMKKSPECTFFDDDNDDESEEVKQKKREKKGRSWLTIIFICNMSGVKEKLKVINRYEKPRALRRYNFDHTKLPVDYYFNDNAIMTSDIFQSIIMKWNEELKIQNRNVLLLLDKLKGHHIDFVPSNIKFLYLHPDSTPVIQPLEAGIIKEFKDHYISRYRKCLLEEMEKTATNIQFAIKKLNIVNVIQLINFAWQDVKTETICDCWKNVLDQKTNFASLFDHNY
ncbi:tigger transposable element-derived protein 6 [Tetranychus urticae]|uniref:tigger transposable element-derived protein 6 n=1 Tax=Tetranychus urticae TaxID=32264 RepID=UPI00077BCC9B|nr:tigger transposable element-derived protein 6 [Tetranychus urticae]